MSPLLSRGLLTPFIRLSTPGSSPAVSRIGPLNQSQQAGRAGQGRGGGSQGGAEPERSCCVFYVQQRGLDIRRRVQAHTHTHKHTQLKKPTTKHNTISRRGEKWQCRSWQINCRIKSADGQQKKREKRGSEEKTAIHQAGKGSNLHSSQTAGVSYCAAGLRWQRR